MLCIPFAGSLYIVGRDNFPNLRRRNGGVKSSVTHRLSVDGVAIGPVSPIGPIGGPIGSVHLLLLDLHSRVHLGSGSDFPFIR